MFQTSDMKDLLWIIVFWIITQVGKVPGLPEGEGPITISQKQNGALFIQGTLANALTYPISFLFLFFSVIKVA